MTTAANNIDAALDAALVMTFPASDPIAVFMPDSSERPVALGWQESEPDSGRQTENNLVKVYRRER